jgi:hypothetical protein
VLLVRRERMVGIAEESRDTNLMQLVTLEQGGKTR